LEVSPDRGHEFVVAAAQTDSAADESHTVRRSLSASNDDCGSAQDQTVCAYGRAPFIDGEGGVRAMRYRGIFSSLIAAVVVSGTAYGQESEALRNARRHFLDSNVNVLTLHSIDSLFLTRRVDNSGSVWTLPRNAAKPDFTYQFGGKDYAALDVLDRTFANALIIIKRGAIVYETYRNQTDASTHFISFSMAKSITSMLIGMALADGNIRSLDDQITQYVPELKESAYDGVTIRQAMDMRSGADYTEQYVTDHPDILAAAFENSMVENRMRFVSITRAMTRAYPPGEHFSYSTFESCVLGWVLERATKQSITKYTSEHLWKPAGMESFGFWMVDGPPDVGREFNGGGFNAVARDYARLGLMMLRAGKAGERQVVPAAWVKESTIPRVREAVNPMDPTLGYHYQWWPVVDSDAYMALGLQGQVIYIDPASETVVVKLSYVPLGNRDAFNETMSFLRAVSRWQVAAK
jgi:CubicO group peptidase (beta-lactamase class C family)